MVLFARRLLRREWPPRRDSAQKCAESIVNSAATGHGRAY
ncbi:DUF982 domain-containing protein [Lacipirellula parvula]